jgi:hypothetical protein
MAKRIPPEVLEYLRKLGKAYGSQGGKTAAKNMTAAEPKRPTGLASQAEAPNRISLPTPSREKRPDSREGLSCNPPRLLPCQPLQQ